MFPQTDKSWCDYKALNQNRSYQSTLAGRAIQIRFLARLDEVQEEILYYPWRWRWHRRRR